MCFAVCEAEASNVIDFKSMFPCRRDTILDERRHAERGLNVIFVEFLLFSNS